jgi:hypothetical protein
MTDREKARAAFRARLKKRDHEAAVLHVADLELGPFLGDLSRAQAEKITAEKLWWLERLDQAEIVAAFLGEPIPFDRRRALIFADIDDRRREVLDDIFTAALKAFSLAHVPPTFTKQPNPAADRVITAALQKAFNPKKGNTP